MGSQGRIIHVGWNKDIMGLIAWTVSKFTYQMVVVGSLALARQGIDAAWIFRNLMICQ